MQKYVTILSVVLLLMVTNCHRTRKRGPVSVVNAGDPGVEKQLVGGFYNIEANAWRWTARKFIVTLGPPAGAEAKGAKLILHFVLPDGQIAKLGAMTLSADIDGESTAPETFTTGGQHVYERDLPAAMMQTNLVPVIFSFDKSAVPGGADDRDLAAIVTLIELVSK